jgi:hypothetical protein
MRQSVSSQPKFESKAIEVIVDLSINASPDPTEIEEERGSETTRIESETAYILALGSVPECTGA